MHANALYNKRLAANVDGQYLMYWSSDMFLINKHSFGYALVSGGKTWLLENELLIRVKCKINVTPRYDHFIISYFS